MDFTRASSTRRPFPAPRRLISGTVTARDSRAGPSRIRRRARKARDPGAARRRRGFLRDSNLQQSCRVVTDIDTGGPYRAPGRRSIAFGCGAIAGTRSRRGATLEPRPGPRGATDTTFAADHAIGRADGIGPYSPSRRPGLWSAFSIVKTFTSSSSRTARHRRDKAGGVAREVVAVLLVQLVIS